MAVTESKDIVRADLHFAEKDQALREDVHRLGELVGELVREQGGEALFDLVEAARRASIQRREGDAESFIELRTLLRALAPSTARDFIRAFSTYFQMVNMAEKVHRIRRRRAYLQDLSTAQPFGFLDVLLGSATISNGAATLSTAGLDPESAREVRELILRLKHERRIVVVKGVVPAICPRASVMRPRPSYSNDSNTLASAPLATNRSISAKSLASMAWHKAIT